MLSGCASNGLQRARPERPFQHGPIYPSPLLEKNIQGSVSAVCDIYTDGRAHNCVITFATHPLFAQAFLDYMREQRYHPASKNGQPAVEHGYTIHIGFSVAKD
ncbi:hypothetical protein C0V97_07900 [Asaia sp. W19]|uniref:energy transducer TonB n=1 Tax=unclassified Asaia TaxID=2685023 RepID=UPI000F8E45B0|nr:hypothetical protein C0V97_07900 [Asaia sp. W19]